MVDMKPGGAVQRQQRSSVYRLWLRLDNHHHNPHKHRDNPDDDDDRKDNASREDKPRAHSGSGDFHFPPMELPVVVTFHSDSDSAVLPLFEAVLLSTGKYHYGAHNASEDVLLLLLKLKLAQSESADGVQYDVVHDGSQIPKHLAQFALQ